MLGFKLMGQGEELKAMLGSAKQQRGELEGSRHGDRAARNVGQGLWPWEVYVRQELEANGAVLPEPTKMEQGAMEFAQIRALRAQLGSDDDNFGGTHRRPGSVQPTEKGIHIPTLTPAFILWGCLLKTTGGAEEAGRATQRRRGLMKMKRFFLFSAVGGVVLMPLTGETC